LSHQNPSLCYNSYFFFSSRRRHTRSKRDWSSDVCSSDLKTKDGQSANLTLASAVKKIPSSVVKLADQAMKGDFPGGKTVTFGLKNGGVGLTSDNLDSAEKQAVQKATDDVKSGDVTVPSKMK